MEEKDLENKIKENIADIFSKNTEELKKELLAIVPDIVDYFVQNKISKYAFNEYSIDYNGKDLEFFNYERHVTFPLNDRDNQNIKYSLEQKEV